MGSITKVTRKSGSVAFRAEVAQRREGKKLTLYETFDREAAARKWIEITEKELAMPGGFERAQAAKAAGKAQLNRTTLGDAIQRYIDETNRELKKTKAQVLRALLQRQISQMACEDIGSHNLVDLAKDLLREGRAPSTVGNYLSHLSSIFAIARPAWKYPLDQGAMSDALKVCKRLGYTSKSNERDRRPTLEELDKLMVHFIERSRRRPNCVPMHRIIAFAIFSTRRQAEIVRLVWPDLAQATKEQAAGIWVRKMKNPGDNEGVDTWCELPPEALAIAEAMLRADEQIFPYSVDAIGRAFTMACEKLGIEDLHFHDLRHEGVSWLIECGRTEKQAMLVSGHKSSTSLQRYSNTRKIWNKYSDWKWLRVVTEPMISPRAASSPLVRPRVARRSVQPGLRHGRLARPSGSSSPS